MARNFARVRARSGARVKVRQFGTRGTRNKVSLSIPRGIRTSLKVKQV